jgi:hypothetical protein
MLEYGMDIKENNIDDKCEKEVLNGFSVEQSKEKSC